MDPKSEIEQALRNALKKWRQSMPIFLRFRAAETGRAWRFLFQRRPSACQAAEAKPPATCPVDFRVRGFCSDYKFDREARDRRAGLHQLQAQGRRQAGNHPAHPARGRELRKKSIKQEQGQVEFVSANPTGPLHVGHGRQAALGDAIAALQESQGNTVTREFYYNDARSADRQARLVGAGAGHGHQARPGGWPEEGYAGEYIEEIARETKDVKDWMPSAGHAGPICERSKTPTFWPSG